MDNPQDNYKISDKVELAGDMYRYYFLSIGKKEIQKAVQYSYVMDIYNLPLYNLGFGDYDKEKDDIVDDTTAGNGDQYKVFHTVLHTIPKLFDACGNVILYVKGSDSTPVFIENCKANCTRNCNGRECKKAHRRMNIYRGFVDKYYDELSKDYFFLGHGLDNIEAYQKGKRYKSVIVMRKNLN